jgi:hypothetical protein
VVVTLQSPSTTAWQAMRSFGAKPREVPKRTSGDVGALRFSPPETISTLHRVQTPTPPQELPRGTPARRATSRIDSLSKAAPAMPSGANVTTLDAVFTGSWQRRTKLSAARAVYYSMSANANETTRSYDESRLAEEIVSILPAGVARQCSPEKNTIRYTLRADGLKLRTIVFSRSSLRRLIEDPARAVKVEYLQRDLLDSATKKKEFRYPRLHIHLKATLPRRFGMALPFASMA